MRCTEYDRASFPDDIKCISRASVPPRRVGLHRRQRATFSLAKPTLALIIEFQSSTRLTAVACGRGAFKNHMVAVVVHGVVVRKMH